MPVLLAIMIGGATGASLRYWIGSYLLKGVLGDFPIGTLAVNILGSFLFGAFLSFFQMKQAEQGVWALALLVGFCGGLTTFSSFAFDCVKLLEKGTELITLSYILLNVIGSIIAVYIGLKLIN